MTEFKAFKKIGRLRDMQMCITQKLHGTNAHILIWAEEDENGSVVTKLKCGSRNRYVTPEDDNFGFATFVYANKEEFITCLGLGRHDGEWCGLGINSGEGLKEKQFRLFDWWRYPEGEPLPPQTKTVPVLYQGDFSMGNIKSVMDELKENGSWMVSGFMRPEGIVIMVNGQRFKQVFLPEDTKWTGGGKDKAPKVKKDFVDYTYLCQPIRLEKLVSKDEALIRNYPKSLSVITKAYVNDLIEEGEIKGDSDEIRAITKGATGQIFKFIRAVMEEL